MITCWRVSRTTLALHFSSSPANDCNWFVALSISKFDRLGVSPFGVCTFAMKLI
jgi:hypothetical protein